MCSLHKLWMFYFMYCTPGLEKPISLVEIIKWLFCVSHSSPMCSLYYPWTLIVNHLRFKNSSGQYKEMLFLRSLIVGNFCCKTISMYVYLNAMYNILRKEARTFHLKYWITGCGGGGPRISTFSKSKFQLYIFLGMLKNIFVTCVSTLLKRGKWVYQTDTTGLKIIPTNT